MINPHSNGFGSRDDSEGLGNRHPDSQVDTETPKIERRYRGRLRELTDLRFVAHPGNTNTIQLAFFPKVYLS